MDMNEAEIKRALSVNRWRLILGSMSDRSLGFSGTDKELRAFEDMEQLNITFYI